MQKIISCQAGLLQLADVLDVLQDSDMCFAEAGNQDGAVRDLLLAVGYINL
jgi:hypothetical protein